MFKCLLFFCVIGFITSCGHLDVGNQNIDKSDKFDLSDKSLTLVPSEFSQLASWEYNNFQNSLIAFQKSCMQVARKQGKTILSKNPLFGYPKDWQSACIKAKDTHLTQARQFFEEEFKPVLVSSDDKGMFTGYYIPELRGSFTQTQTYRYPIYATPQQKGKLPSRAQIVQGALNHKAKPLLWVDSEVDSFFLHIQGSGNIRLPDNRIVHVAYAGQNGHKYYAIGQYLIKENYIPKEKMSAQAIKDWLNNNPSKAQYVMNLNPSYVFFNLKDGQTTQQAKGAAGVPLTPEYSLAVDDEYYPYGIPIWVETGVQVPKNGELQDMAFDRLMIAQDTGGAINGAVRGDIFFGSGKIAEIMASTQKNNGRKYVLLPRDVVMNNN